MKDLKRGITLGNKAEFDEWKWTSLAQLAAEVVTFRREVYRELLKRWSSTMNT
jgi:hypothetical protein